MGSPQPVGPTKPLGLRRPRAATSQGVARAHEPWDTMGLPELRSLQAKLCLRRGRHKRRGLRRSRLGDMGSSQPAGSVTPTGSPGRMGSTEPMTRNLWRAVRRSDAASLHAFAVRAWGGGGQNSCGSERRSTCKALRLRHAAILRIETLLAKRYCCNETQPLRFGFPKCWNALDLRERLGRRSGRHMERGNEEYTKSSVQHAGGTPPTQ